MLRNSHLLLENDPLKEIFLRNLQSSVRRPNSSGKSGRLANRCPTCATTYNLLKRNHINNNNPSSLSWKGGGWWEFSVVVKSTSRRLTQHLGCIHVKEQICCLQGYYMSHITFSMHLLTANMWVCGQISKKTVQWGTLRTKRIVW